MFSVSFAILKKAPFEPMNIIRRITLTNWDGCMMHLLKTTEEEGDLWSLKKNKGALKGMAQYATCTNDNFAERVRATIDSLHAEFPDTGWVTNTAGPDFFAVSHLLVNKGYDPMHYNHEKKYCGYKFFADESILRIYQTQSSPRPKM